MAQRERQDFWTIQMILAYKCVYSVQTMCMYCLCPKVKSVLIGRFKDSKWWLVLAIWIGPEVKPPRQCFKGLLPVHKTPMLPLHKTGLAELLHDKRRYKI